MPDKKLTDNDIKKALEEVLKLMLCNGDLQRSSTISKTLAYINHLETENERLKNIGDNKTKELLRYNTCIEELHKNLKTAKVEAIKEFVNKVIAEHSFEYYGDMIVLEADIYNVLKEMVGD